MIDFQRKNIVITGASSGLGEALSIFLLELNANVIGIARNEEKLKNIKSNHSNFNYLVKDLTEDIDSNSKILNEVFEKYGEISGLVLNAGVQETKPIAATSYESARKIFDVNYFANLSLIKGLKKKFIHQDGLSIVASSSITSKLSIAGLANYASSKAALESLIRTISVEFEKMNVRANSVSIGHVKTELLNDSKLGKAYLEKLENIYTNGLIELDNVNSTFAFLLSNLSKNINGSNIVLDSGVSNKFLA